MSGHTHIMRTDGRTDRVQGTVINIVNSGTVDSRRSVVVVGDPANDYCDPERRMMLENCDLLWCRTSAMILFHTGRRVSSFQDFLAKGFVPSVTVCGNSRYLQQEQEQQRRSWRGFRSNSVDIDHDDERRPSEPRDNSQTMMVMARCCVWAIIFL